MHFRSSKFGATNTVSYSVDGLYSTARMQDGYGMSVDGFPPGPAVTLKGIARKLSLSHGTVSKALRNDPEISESTRERVQETAREMGYQPNPMGAGLAEFKRGSKRIPVRAALAWINCWPDPKKLHSFTEFDWYWRGAVAAAEKQGYRLEEFICDKRLPPGRLEQILLSRGIHGILLPPHPAQPAWNGFRWELFSVVRLGHSLTEPRVDVVTADQVGNTFIAMDAIRAQGYRRIGYMGLQATEDRRWLFEAGYLRAQLELKEQDRLPMILLDRPDSDQSLRAVADWLSAEKPDVVLSPLPEAPNLLQQCRYRIPEDIGFAAMSVLDGKADAGIHQNPEEIGRAASRALIALIHENARGIPSVDRELLVKGRWVDGSSLPPRCLRL